MANLKINYIDCNQVSFCNEPLYRERDLYDNQYVYTKCPVFNHKSNRTFVGVSPIDFTIRVDRNSELILSDNENLVFCDREHLFSPNPVFQLSFPQFLFWTKEENIWLEFNDHPMTSLNNNLIAVGGWFNISNWPRNTSMAFTVVDPVKPVIIKKGDPLFRISFYSQNLDVGIILKKIDDPIKVSEIMKNYNNSMDRNKFDWKKILFSKTSKCPFKFLYDK